MNQKKRSFAVVGLGNFGSTVAHELVRFGNYVIGIDSDESRVAAHAEGLDQALILDARDDEALRQAGLSECKIGLVAMGHDLEASVLTAINLRLIGIETIWAKAISKTHHRILSKLGVDRIVHPEVEVGHNVAQVLHNPLVRDYVSLGNGFHVFNLRIPEALTGCSLSDLNLMQRYGIRCVGVMRGTEFVGDETTECSLEGDDRLLILGRREDLRAFASNL